LALLLGQGSQLRQGFCADVQTVTHGQSHDPAEPSGRGDNFASGRVGAG
jgi:hypothetical protein